MNGDILAAAIRRAEERDLSVMDLIHAAEAAAAAGGPAAALPLYAAWVAHNADNPLLYAVLFNQCVILSATGRLEEARAGLERAIALNPDFLSAHINLGHVLERLGSPADAVMRWTDLLNRLAPVTGSAVAHKTTALNQLARVLEESHQDEPAEAMLHQSLDLDRNQREVLQHYVALRQRQCEWPVVRPWDRVGREALVAGMSPLSMAAWADDPMLHLAAAWNYNLRDVGAPGPGLVTSHWAALEGQGGGPLRVGYLSSDLRDHAVGYLTAEVFGLHDRGRVEVYAYYCGPRLGGALQERIKGTVDHWLDIGDLDDAAAARRIADDGIQILVDLNGYTRDGRTKLVALRPAPVIVNWLGYPGTMGSPYHHYIIADDWIIPPDDEIFYSETVLRLPCYQPNDRQRTVAADRPTRAEMGLPDDAMVFCCFNGLHKITRFTAERWLTVLERVPGSVLWLLSGAPGAEARLRDLATARGIAAERLVFAEKMANARHLARYPLADLFLDTMPYGAHTTASDALWMGVPMLTLSGRSFASRVCGSLLRAAGLPELVCATPGEYVDRAVALGRDRARTARYRERLAARRESCALFDTPGLVRRLEDLFEAMWDDCRQGRLPVPDLANLDVYLETGMTHDHDAVEATAIPDLRGWWRDRLARRHAWRPVPADRRLWG
ncbi:tetratricopeptide repeat protein [Azospirillum sp. RWY-5-1]|uniref:protein O-GlcNAc transferase n=1 Tax=Azospirillum oleiclasticum TaxID=2735135 RepID=A0ABX2TLW0_9PROT|nr:tetratricopeptide repeat protein [Azospirillum oleiclasticum]NYZ17079.1 tetratricopeptide repeat protein [Azospirillum oleiclasticum]NYZ24217.1 tetratricopeptide repeat protein [Azospirillum oleiclasticum]